MPNPSTPKARGRHFFANPGPTNIPDSVLRALDRPSIDFNDAEAALSFCRENRPGLIMLAAASAQGEAAGLIHKFHHVEGCADVPVIVIGAEEDLDADALLSADGHSVERSEPRDRHGHRPDDHHRHADD